MKKNLSIYIMILAPLFAFAQVQRGYVKEKGYLVNNGKIIASKPLQGVTIRVKNSNPVISDKRGKFSLVTSKNKYSLLSVEKNGYFLINPELGEQYSCSENPLTILMENKKTKQDEKKEKQEKLRNIIEKNREKERKKIEKLKEENTITEEKYESLLLELVEEIENDDRIINDVTDHYLKMDFNEIDKFNLRIYQHIMEGKLMEANFLINTKGDVHTRTTELLQLLKRDAKDETKGKNILLEVKNRLKILLPSNKKVQRLKDDIANDCYNKFIIFKLMHQYDSAAHYIVWRAELDTLNIVAQDDAADFLCEYMSKNEEALAIYRRMLNVAIQEYGNDSSKAAMCHNNLGRFFLSLGQYQSAEQHFSQALSTYKALGDGFEYFLAVCEENIGSLCSDKEDYTIALSHYENAMDIYRKLYGDNCDEMANTYNSIGDCHKEQQNYQLAEEYFNKAKVIWMRLYGKDSYEVSVTNNHLAGVLQNTGRYQEALKLYDNILAIRIKEYGDSHPSVATIFNNKASLFIKMNELDSAYICQTQAIEIVKNVYGEKSPIIVDYYGNISKILQQKNDWKGSLDALKKAYDIASVTESIATRHIIANMDYVLAHLLQEYDDAEIRDERERFMRDKVYVALIQQDESSPAAQLGMSGEYYILEYEDWNINSNTSMLLTSERLSGKPKTIVFMKEDSIQSHHFKNRIGTNFFLKVVGEEKKKELDVFFKCMQIKEKKFKKYMLEKLLQQ